MYLILLLLGAALTVAGIALGASGVSVHERLFDATLVTPGIVSAVGGLLLVGLGLGLRVLQRIEQAIAARPVTRATRPSEASETTATKELAIEPARIPFPSKLAPPAYAAPVAMPAPAGERSLEDLPEKISAAPRLESARLKEEMEFPLPPLAPPRLDEQVGETPPSRRRNGAAPARITPRFELGGRSAVTPDRQKGPPTFDAVWPKVQRPLRAAQLASAQGAALPAVQSEPREDPAPDGDPAAAPDQSPESVSILKSGVVDGMAYTLYSDGSIEAQLPKGTLRFGSIAELRTHIEQGA